MPWASRGCLLLLAIDWGGLEVRRYFLLAFYGRLASFLSALDRGLLFLLGLVKWIRMFCELFLGLLGCRRRLRIRICLLFLNFRAHFHPVEEVSFYFLLKGIKSVGFVLNLLIFLKLIDGHSFGKGEFTFLVEWLWFLVIYSVAGFCNFRMKSKMVDSVQANSLIFLIVIIVE